MLEQLQFGSDGEIRNKVETAIKRLQAFEPPEGYFTAFSGGKDSQCVYHLCKMAGVKFDAHYAVTSVDPDEGGTKVMNRKRKIRQLRKEIMRLGAIESIEVLKEPGLPKREWGYVVHACVNGEHISAVDDSWCEAYKGCLEAARWLSTQNTPLE